MQGTGSGLAWVLDHYKEVVLVCVVKEKGNVIIYTEGGMEGGRVIIYTYPLSVRQCHRLTWGHHDLVFLGPDAQEGQFVVGVEVTHRCLGLPGQLVQESSVLHCSGIVHGGPDRDTCRGGGHAWGYQ